MALALCHILPRDNIMRSAVLMMLLSFLMAIIGLTRVEEDAKSMGSLKGTASGNAYELNINAAQIVNPTNGQVLCPYDENNKPSNAVQEACNDFRDYMIGSAYVGIVSCALCIISIIFIALIVVPLSSTTAKMVGYFWVATLPPFITAVVTIATVNSGAIPQARKFAELQAGEKPDYKFGFAFNLGIAALTFVALAFACSTFRLIHSVFVRPKLKENVVGKQDIAGFMGLHLVNDDWTRQKKMWAKHATSVEITAVAVADQPAGDDEPPQPAHKHKRSMSIYGPEDAPHGGDDDSDTQSPESPVYVHSSDPNVTDSKIRRKVENEPFQ